MTGPRSSTDFIWMYGVHSASRCASARLCVRGIMSESPPGDIIGECRSARATRRCSLLHPGLLRHVPRDLLAGSEPHTRLRLHVLDELLEVPHGCAMAGD